MQASAYKSADVVSTLRNALMVDGKLSMTFNNEQEVLAYLANKILLPTWKDPVCGDGAPLLLAWLISVKTSTHGRFGCMHIHAHPHLQLASPSPAHASQCKWFKESPTHARFSCVHNHAPHLRF